MNLRRRYAAAYTTRRSTMNKYFVMVLFALFLLLIPSCRKDKGEKADVPVPEAVTENDEITTAEEKVPSGGYGHIEGGTEEASVPPADGERVYRDNIFYTYSPEKGGYVVTSNAVTYSREAAIAGNIDGIPVVAVGENAFIGNESITGTLYIPGSVKEIGSGAFAACTSLTGLRLDEGIEIIGSGAFSGDKSLSGDLAVPSTVTAIGDGAFMDCSGFDGGLYILGKTAIGERAFYGCSGLKELAFISALSIGKSAFGNCTGLKGDLIIPDSVREIGDEAFYNCSGLDGTLVILGAETIGERAFKYCSSLRGDLILPSTLKSIGKCAFAHCSGFDGTLVLSSSLSSVEKGTFYMSGFSCDVIIPESVKTIDTRAFEGTAVTPYFTSPYIEIASDAFTPGTVIPAELL